MSNHTPGPWLLTHDNFVYALNERGTNQFWAHVNYGWKGQNAEERTSSEEIEANARLIIAAPDMILALEDMVVSYEHEASSDNPSLLAARAAIAKARGAA